MALRHPQVAHELVSAHMCFAWGKIDERSLARSWGSVPPSFPVIYGVVYTARMR